MKKSLKNTSNSDDSRLAAQQTAYDNLLATINAEANLNADYAVRINGLAVDLLPTGTDYRQTLTDA